MRGSLGKWSSGILPAVALTSQSVMVGDGAADLLSDGLATSISSFSTEGVQHRKYSHPDSTEQVPHGNRPFVPSGLCWFPVSARAVSNLLLFTMFFQFFYQFFLFRFTINASIGFM